MTAFIDLVCQIFLPSDLPRFFKPQFQTYFKCFGHFPVRHSLCFRVKQLANAYISVIKHKQLASSHVLMRLLIIALLNAGALEKVNQVKTHGQCWFWSKYIYIYIILNIYNETDQDLAYFEWNMTNDINKHCTTLTLYWLRPH